MMYTGYHSGQSMRITSEIHWWLLSVWWDTDISLQWLWIGVSTHLWSDNRRCERFLITHESPSSWQQCINIIIVSRLHGSHVSAGTCTGYSNFSEVVRPFCANDCTWKRTSVISRNAFIPDGTCCAAIYRSSEILLKEPLLHIRLCELAVQTTQTTTRNK